MLKKTLDFYHIGNEKEVSFIVENEIISFKRNEIPEEIYNRKILNDSFVSGNLIIHLI